MIRKDRGSEFYFFDCFYYNAVGNEMKKNCSPFANSQIVMLWPYWFFWLSVLIFGDQLVFGLRLLNSYQSCTPYLISCIFMLEKCLRKQSWWWMIVFFPSNLAGQRLWHGGFNWSYELLPLSKNFLFHPFSATLYLVCLPVVVSIFSF